MNKDEIEKIKKAGEFAKQVVEHAKSIIKPGMKLLDIANKIDDKIFELGAKPAFPINLSVNEVAAHSTPSFNDESIAEGLLKVDIGIHVDGFVADTAFSLDLENNDENKRLIKSAESALMKALDIFDKNIELREIGRAIQEELNLLGFVPIQNLTGHKIERYDLHAGMNIPNYDNGQITEISNGLYAIEPFSTNGIGKVKDGKPSGIYQIIKEGNVRDSFARDVLGFISEEYKTLPFCSRWIHKKFGGRGILALRQIEQAGIIHQYSQLVESSNGKVAQAEHSVLITKEGKFITTK